MRRGMPFLIKLRRIFTKNKVFIQRALGYMTMVNSGMILFLLLSKLQDYGISIYITRWFFPIFMLGIVAMILVGYLDYRFGFHREEMRARSEQNPYMGEILERLDRIEKKVNKKR